MAQGAHFLSHNIWTLLIDWLIALTLYHWMFYKKTTPPSTNYGVVKT